MKNVIYYNAKVIKSGDTIELYTFEKEQTKLMTLEEMANLEGLNGVETDEQEKKKITKPRKKKDKDIVTFKNKQSLQKTKQRLKRLINTNLSQDKEHDKFMTLTFAENIKDVKVANIHLDRFLKRLRYYFKKNGKSSDFRYICVPELQDGSRNSGNKSPRNAIHYHLLIFGMPYIDHKMLVTIWNLGRIEIKALSDYGDVAGYLANYLTSDDNEELKISGMKSYYSSRNLKKAEEFYFKNAFEASQMLFENGTNIDCTYHTDYENAFTGTSQYTKFKNNNNIEEKEL